VNVSGQDLSGLAAEQAALRRVATLVAGGAAPEEVFAAITEEVGRLLPVDFADMSHCEPDGAVTFVAAWGTTAAVFPVGSRWIPEGNNLCSIVARTGRPARIESYADASGPIDVAVRGTGIRSGVGTPIIVDGRLWGVMAAGSSRDEPMPADTEARLTQFTELLASAVANAESRAGLARLADEQAALRRVATLVAQDAPSSQLFGAVAREVGTLLGADFSGMIRYEDDATVSTVATWAAVGEHPPVPDRWPTEPGDPATMIAETRQPARVEDWAAVPGPIAAVIREELGVSSSVGCPIMVEGRLWGALAIHSKQPVALPPDTEARAAQFADLVATAIGNAEARAEVARLAREQAALRRVATLVAREASQAEVFTAIAEEIGQLLGTEEIRVMRYEDERSAVVVAGSGELEQAFPIGSHHRLEGESAISRVFRTARPVRIDDYGTASGPVANTARSIGVQCVLATPVVVEGRLWGAMVGATTRDEPLPPETESRFGQFTELMATAIANTESHARAERLSDEQAALRRVATLVAQGVPPAEIFTAASDEIGRLFGAHAGVVRFEPEGSAIVFVGVGRSLEGLPVGARWELDDSMASTEVYRTGRSARVDAVDWSSRSGPVAEAGRRLGVVSTIASPIIVEGRRWGAVTVSSMEEPLAVGVEERLENFTDLVATAIGNAEAREARGRLTDEQAALRRVATLVAEGASPTAVFDAVAGEMEALLDADQVALNRFEPGDEITVLAHRGLDASRTPVGSRVSLEGESVTATVRRTGRPARMESYEGATGALAELARATGERSSVGAPIVVDGRLWGIITASWKGEQPPAAGTEARMAQFAELLDTAIANADSRDQLTASRARLLTEGDDARRRVVRDLHDGAQQRLVHTIIRLKLAQRASEENDREAPSLIGEALEQAELGHAELRELAHGILPGALTRGGLRAGVDAMVARLDLPVQVHVPTERFPAEIEASAYFIVAEALTNVVKHSTATRAEVGASVADGMLQLEIRDDGIGGADPDGHGLVAMADRVTALGGRLEIESPAGAGTLLAAALPLSAG
jgi:GAF domain-containing protein